MNMTCLSDAEVQAVADNEGNDAATAHAAACGRCAERVATRRRQMADFVALTGSDAPVPSRLEAEVRRVLAGGHVRGSTALRERAPVWRSRAWVSAFAGGAVIAVLVSVVLPRLGAPPTLSAATILGRSLQTLNGGGRERGRRAESRK